MSEDQYLGKLRDHPEAFDFLEASSDTEFDLQGWMWCRHCQRAYPVADLRVIRFGREYILKCPVDDCDGTLPDWHPWTNDSLPRQYRPEYPATPQAYEEYPLYGREA